MFLSLNIVVELTTDGRVSGGPGFIEICNGLLFIKIFSFNNYLYEPERFRYHSWPGVMIFWLLFLFS